MLSFNEYEEKKVQLAEGLKAEDYEAAIVIGWYKNNKKKFKPEDVGINPGVFKILLKSPLGMISAFRLVGQIIFVQM